MPLVTPSLSIDYYIIFISVGVTTLLYHFSRYMEENTRQVQDQVEYNRHFSELDTECQKYEEEISRLQKELLEQSGKKEQTRRCLYELRKRGNKLEEFDAELWNSMVDFVTISTDKIFEFCFRDGTRVTVPIPEIAK